MSEPRVVVVTGASRGIGLAVASWFAAHGDQVVALSSTGTEVPGAARSVACDVTDSTAVDAAFTEVEEGLGNVDVLVANAGITIDQLALRMSDDAWQRVLDVNLSGAFYCARRALRKMVRSHAGRIVFVSSVGAFVGLPGQANYAASKAGLVGLARALSREVASRGVTVNVVAPGLVDTDMLGAVGDDRRAQLASLVPLGRIAAPEEVAGLVGFVASADAAYMTGAVLPLDGGLAMGL
ncbi:MAG TPA: 3-oxoacyl-ACP reductase FabG [Acidimicrobiales bacterium]|nr:3-oxoacyl-ACP reductase FabG [Acidimicrobiales bacterium]